MTNEERLALANKALALAEAWLSNAPIAKIDAELVGDPNRAAIKVIKIAVFDAIGFNDELIDELASKLRPLVEKRICDREAAEDEAFLDHVAKVAAGDLLPPGMTLDKVGRPMAAIDKAIKDAITGIGEYYESELDENDIAVIETKVKALLTKTDSA